MINKDFGVAIVKKHLFGKKHMSKDIMKNIGLNYGLQAIIRFVGLLICPVTAFQSLNGLKTTGSRKIRLSLRIFPLFDIWFWTALIFIRTAVS